MNQPTIAIPRTQTKEILNALQTSKILIVNGPSHNQKKELVENILNDQSLPHYFIDETEIGHVNREEGDWTEWQKKFWDRPYLVLERAELFQDINPFLEQCLVDEASPSVVCLCDFEPPLQPLLMEAIQSNDLMIQLYPPSFYEIAQAKGMGALEEQLEQRLIYGSYERVMENPEDAQAILDEFIDEMIASSLSAKERINKKGRLKHVLQVFAFEMGNLISYNEVGVRTGLDNETVERYVQLFEKANIVKIIPSYFGGNKYEMKKGNSVFFIDNGIRNALINNFNPMEWRQDATQLWRNWLLMEKMKWNNLIKRNAELYTWRTHTNQRIDFMERFDGKIKGYQTSWTKNKTPKFPASFGKYYPEAKQSVLNRSTYWTFLSSKK